MNHQTFLHYLEQPATLASLPQEELAALAEAYPHAANVRLLLALKARLDNDPDAGHLMERFSAATFDRPHLFDMLRHADRPVAPPTETLELRELDELELVPAGQVFDEIPSRLNEGRPAVAIPSIPPFYDAPVSSEDRPKKEGISIEQITTTSPTWTDLAADFHSILSTDHPVIVEPDGPEASEKFDDLLIRNDRRRVLNERLRLLRSSVVGVQKNVSSPDSAHPAVVSETLAELLCRQGQYGNAIRMYRRLMLLYPEKKPIFAGLIQELKLKL